MLTRGLFLGPRSIPTGGLCNAPSYLAKCLYSYKQTTDVSKAVTEEDLRIFLYCEFRVTNELRLQLFSFASFSTNNWQTAYCQAPSQPTWTSCGLRKVRWGDLMFHVLSNLMRKDSLGVKVIWKAVI